MSAAFTESVVEKAARAGGTSGRWSGAGILKRHTRNKP